MFSSSKKENLPTKKEMRGLIPSIPKKNYVSDEFLDIYSNFNVSSQIEKMKKLSKKELYLILCVSLDNHDYKDDDTVRLNLLEFKEEIKNIYKLHNGDNQEIEELKELSIDLDKDITTHNLVDKGGNSLPKAKTKQEVRDIRINEITS